MEQFASEDTIFEILANREICETPNLEANLQEVYSAFQNDQSVAVVEKQIIHPHLPIDWSLKTKLRILSKVQVFGNQLKMNQEASGLTGFVRCIDHKSTTTGLDISPGALFHQNTLYWQYPNLPWLTLFPRNSKLNNNAMKLGENEKLALLNDWRSSFASLFQLVRTRQCPYFYVCANSFTVLFRAAGIGGRIEVHALMTPSSRGLRSALREANIEFVMPLKKSTADTSHNKSDQESFNESIDQTKTEGNGESEEESDEGEEKWLESMGVPEDEIKKIRSNRSRKQAAIECENDFSDLSLILIDGFECHALFNFLLNAKSITTPAGKLSGVPPTLLSPVAFHGASLKRLETKSSKVRVDQVDYYSVELKGPILSHLLPYLVDLLKHFNDQFSITTTNLQNTVAFSRASQTMMEGDSIYFKLNKEI